MKTFQHFQSLEVAPCISSFLRNSHTVLTNYIFSVTYDLKQAKNEQSPLASPRTGRYITYCSYVKTA